MSHFDFTRPSGVWPPEFVPGQADFQRLDVKQSKTLNGDAGGGYSPTKPIIIGGAGVQITGPAAITGGVTTQTGGALVTDNDAPALLPLRTRTLVVPLLGCGVHTDAAFLSANAMPFLEESQFIPDFTNVNGVPIYGIQALTQASLYFEIPRRYLHNVARLATVALTFMIPTRPSSVPLLPLIAILSFQSGTVFNLVPTLSSMPHWTPTTSYSVGQYVVATVGNSAGFYFKATAVLGAGLSGTTEPGWPTAVGGFVQDNPSIGNGIVWTCIGRNGLYPDRGVTIDSFWAHGNPQTLYFDTDGSIGNVISVTSAYRVMLQEPAPGMILTGLSLSYDSIGSLAWE